jgi:hypothetical protein
VGKPGDDRFLTGNGSAAVAWGFGALWRFGVDRLPRRDLAGSPPALERRLIAFPKAQDKALYRVEPAHRK